ncbi:MAG: FecR domain-containing protein [Myxococcota bacterium]
MSDRTPTPKAIKELGRDWDEARVEALIPSLHARVRVRRRRAMILAGSAVAAAAAGMVVFFVGNGFDPSENSTPSGVRLSERVIHLPDGSSATLLDEASEVVIDDSAGTLRLPKGGAIFRVQPRTSRPFRVTAADVLVEVLGTEFQVRHRAASVEIDVFEGRVRASQGASEVELGAGESHRFVLQAETTAEAPELEGTDMPVVAETDIELDPVDDRDRSAPHTTPTPTERRPDEPRQWRQLAQGGNFEEAYARLREGPAPTRVPDLMLAADAARFSGNPTRAVGYLRTVRTEHRSDPRAALAAFTEGRILLGQLGRPSEAAAAFRVARQLAPGGPLAEDSLAREIEALSRAGAGAQASVLAQEYLRRYPQGRRAAAVRHHAGVE